MKKQNNYLLQPLNTEVMETLIHIVDETIAKNYKKPALKMVFTQANLWNIHKQKRTFVQRRNF